jgi:hypothetical protein
MEGISGNINAKTFVKFAEGRVDANYTIGEKLGEGAFGVVHMGVSKTT